MAVIRIENAHKIIPAMRRGIASALNKTMKRSQTAANKKVREVYNIKAGDLRGHVKFIKANINKSVAGFWVEGERLTLTRFSARDEHPKGVTVRIKKTSGRKRIRSAFMELGRGGKLQVFMREGKSRYPIRVLKTVGPVKMFEKEGEKAVEETIEKNFFPILNHEIGFRLDRI